MLCLDLWVIKQVPLLVVPEECITIGEESEGQGSPGKFETGSGEGLAIPKGPSKVICYRLLKCYNLICLL